MNMDHSPIAVVSAQKAIVLTLLEKANVLTTYDLLEIRTVSRSFSYPAVIRLNEYKSTPYRGVLLNRLNVFRRDNGECQYCGSKKQLTIELREPVERVPAGLEKYDLTLSSDGQELIYTYETHSGRTGITGLLADLSAEGLALRDISTRQDSLEEIFVGLVEEGAA